MRDFLAVFLSALLLWSVDAESIWQDPSSGISFKYEEIEGGVSIKGILDAEVLSLRIPEEMDGLPVKEIGRAAFASNKYLEFVEIGDGVVIINDMAFDACANLKEIIIGPCVREIRQEAFCTCANLKSVIIKGEALEKIEYWAFHACSSLEEINLPKSVNSIDAGAFREAKLPNSYNVNGLVIVDGCLLGLASEYPSNVVIPDGVRFLSEGSFDMFGSWTTSAGSVYSISMPASVECIGKRTFEGCASLSCISVRGCGRFVVRNGLLCDGAVVLACPAKLSEVEIPDDIVELADSAFYSSAITNVVLPPKLKRIGDLCFRRSSLLSVETPYGFQELGSSAFLECRSLTNVALKGVQSIGDRVFEKCYALKSVELGRGLVSIGLYPFDGCVALKSVELPDTLEEYDRWLLSNTSATYPFMNGIKNVRAPFEICEDLKASGCYVDIAFEYTTPPKPIIVPPDGTVFSDVIKVMITNAMADAVIRYTTDGSVPTEDSPIFKKFTATEKTVVRAIAEHNGYKSATVTATFGKGKVSAPTITSSEGESFYSSTNVISINCITDLTTIYYTLDGSTPTTESQRYDGPFSITNTTTVRAISVGHPEYVDSDVVTTTFYKAYLTVDMPNIKAYYGTFQDGVETTVLEGSFLWVVMDCATDNAKIHYTLDGTLPTKESPVYDEPFKISDSTTIKAVGIKDDWRDSKISSVRIVKNWTIGDALNVPDVRFETSIALGWVNDDEDSHDGSASMRSGRIGDGGETVIQTSIAGSGALTFWWKSSCEETDMRPYWWDYGSLVVDGREVAWIDGETDWMKCVIDVEGDGNHLIAWRYRKDNSGSDGRDCIWLDEIVWKPTVISRISYEGLCGATHVNPETYQEETVVAFTPPSGRTGYTFTGWTPAAITADMTGAQTVTAGWRANAYQIAYYANGGSGTMTATDCEYDAEGEIAANGFTRSGYLFLGWATEENGEVVYRPGDKVTNLTSNDSGVVKLYAVWEAENVLDPVITPSDGSIFKTESCTVTIACATEGAEIYYSTNGRTPRTTEANRYTGPFTISDTATIVAVAVKDEKTSEYVEATITKVIPEPLTLVGVLDEPKLADVATGGDAEWLPIEDETAKVGGSCAVSGALDDDGEEEVTWLEAKVYGKGTLTFWWRVNCEPDPRAGKFTYDFAAFEADDEVVVRKDGESDWVQVTKTFATDGEHVIRWSYNTDGFPRDDYDGCVWVDGVTWSGSAAPEEQPKPTIEGDEGATVTGDAETGFVVKPSEGKTAVVVTIPQGVDVAKVTVEVSVKVANVKPNGAKVKIVNVGADITQFLNVPAADGSGVVDLTKATVKEEIVKEAMDVKKGAKIVLDAVNPSLTTSNTREGLLYKLREGTTIGGMNDGDSKVGDGKPWSPKITVKGGNSAFYSIGVGKGE